MEVTMNVKRWAPKRLTEGEILDIITDYGVENDSLLSEKCNQNPVSWDISITVKPHDNMGDKNGRT